MDDVVRARIKKLIALSSSSNENEARNAAYKACELLRAHGIEPETVFAKGALPAAPGWTPPPTNYPQPAPQQPQPNYQTLILPETTDVAEQMRIMQRQAEMREAQAQRARYQLSLASKQIETLEEETERLRQANARKAEQVRQLRMVLGPQGTTRPGTKPLPVGAGRREPR